MASDTTDYRFTDRRPDWVSLVSVAIAVDDIEEFNKEYKRIIADKSERYGIPLKDLVIKNQDVSKWVSEWKQEEARNDIITTLLQIDTISNIQLTETSLEPQWITLFNSESRKSEQVEAHHFVNHTLKQYYNLTSIWIYLRENDEMPWGHRNVMTDQFNGKITKMWNEVCERSDNIHIVPHGDQTYPLLSLADLTMNFVRQEVDEWKIDKIHRELEDNTPSNSAYVESRTIEGGDDLKSVIPYTTSEIRTRIHYPHPVIYIDTTDVDNDVVRNSDIYASACKVARQQGGSVKFFDRGSDEGYLHPDDYLICLNNNTSKFNDYIRLNNEKSITILDVEDCFEQFRDLLK